MAHGDGHNPDDGIGGTIISDAQMGDLAVRLGLVLYHVSLR